MNFSRVSAANIFASVVLAGTGMTSPVQAQQANMTFFCDQCGQRQRRRSRRSGGR